MQNWNEIPDLSSKGNVDLRGDSVEQYNELEEPSHYRICANFPSGCHQLGTLQGGFPPPHEIDGGATPLQIKNAAAQPPPECPIQNVLPPSTKARRSWAAVLVSKTAPIPGPPRT